MYHQPNKRSTTLKLNIVCMAYNNKVDRSVHKLESSTLVTCSFDRKVLKSVDHLFG